MVKLSDKEISLAKNGRKKLETYNLDAKTGEAELVLHEENETKIALPRLAVVALAEVLTHFSEGQDVKIRAVREELTSQKAGEFLNVSRPFLIKLLENGEIPYRKVGTHRRILLSDLEDYKQRIDEKRLKVLAELAAQAQDLEMGY